MFSGIYRKLLCHMELKAAESGNCVPLENISILMCSSSLKCINETTALSRKDDGETDDESDAEDDSPLNENENAVLQILDDTQLTEYTQQIVGYIGGCVVRCLRKKIKCTLCIESLLAKEKNNDCHRLVSARDKGGLIYCSKDVYSVCMISEKTIRKFIKQKLALTTKIHSKMVSSILKQFVGTSHFAAEDHQLHQVHLTKLVVEKYLAIRCHHLCKLDDLDMPSSKRRLYKKEIQREGH